MMKLTVLIALIAACTVMAAESGPSPVYEMRIYQSSAEKLEDLHARFRNHTLKLFEKHKIKNVGYFVPAENKEHKLYFILSYPSRQAREDAWKAFMADPDWQKAARESEKNGRLVTKVEQIFMEETDYSPKLNIQAAGNRVFELRTYTTPEGKLGDLDNRFRNHTIGLFKKHGMDNLIYWHKTADQPGAKTSLIYLLAHKSRDAAKASFDSFRQDPDWVTARTESEKNGSLTAPGGVQSLFLVPTDYSPLK